MINIKLMEELTEALEKVIEEIAECYLDSRQARDLIEDKVEDYLYDLEDRVNDILEDSDIIEDKVNDILKDSDIIKTEICMPNYELRLAELEINNIYNELYKEVLWQRAR